VYLVIPRSMGKIEKYVSPKLTDYFIHEVRKYVSIDTMKKGEKKSQTPLRVPLPVLYPIYLFISAGKMTSDEIKL
jgi:hypothetical protein